MAYSRMFRSRPIFRKHSRAALPCIRLLLLGLWLGLWGIVANQANGQSSTFTRAAEILQRRCVRCHNDSQNAGQLSLQTQAALASGLIEPGNSHASYLIDVLLASDTDQRMPQGAEPLSDQEIQTLREWIDAGAKWPDGYALQSPAENRFDWWSFKPLQPVPVPKLDSPWIRSDIDAFVLDQLKKKGLAPSPPADRRTLIRRLTYDLTGLPPSLEEVARFVNSTDPHAYEKLVDRLLDSERYGERWAQHWLDIVQYADTCGYDKDKLRLNAWPYRDYVIRSFNQDKPYRQFVQEQIAGDVLYPDDPDGILGLGFIAAGPWDFIGHVEVPESKLDGKVARNLDRDNMVTNTINTFCSLTVQCARCHDHKFDPILQTHYYGLQSIFAAVDRAERPYDLYSETSRRRERLADAKDSLQRRRTNVQAEISKAGGNRLVQLRQEIAEIQGQAKVNQSQEYGFHSQLASAANTPKWVALDLGGATSVSEIVLHPCHDRFAGIGAGFGFPVHFSVHVQQSNSSQWQPVFSVVDTDHPNPGLEPLVIDCALENVRRVRVLAHQIAERQNDYCFALAEVEVMNTVGRNVALNCPVSSLDSIEAPRRWSRKNLVDGQWPTWQTPAVAGKLAHAQAELLEWQTRPELAQLLEHEKTLAKSIEEKELALRQLPAGKMVYAAATNFEVQGNFKPTLGNPRAIYVLRRGDVTQPGPEAIAGRLPLNRGEAWQLGAGLSDGERRAALARWLTDPEHPLVWRSIVNRVWQYHFGQGIVDTPNDFGHMGATPTHPELLDWLAIRFRDSGQSFKQLHRQIVCSSTYRQTSANDPAQAAVDGSNQFLWRMQRRRLDAEEIRDSILLLSGQMQWTMGGPGYFLFALEKPEHSPHFEYHKFNPADETSHRRSIYRFRVRSQPNPWMSNLDCADSSQSTPRRNQTETSLQALSLWNNRFNLHAAQEMAERLEEQNPDVNEQIELAFGMTLQRSPTDEEAREFREFCEAHGLANTCRCLLNLSEFVYLD